MILFRRAEGEISFEVGFLVVRVVVLVVGGLPRRGL